MAESTRLRFCITGEYKLPDFEAFIHAAKAECDRHAPPSS